MFFFNKQQHPLSENALFQLQDFRTGQNQNIIKILFENLKKKSTFFSFLWQNSNYTPCFRE